MRLLDRYFIRHLLPPLAFAFMALTSIMLLNQVGKRFGELRGQGHVCRGAGGGVGARAWQRRPAPVG